MNNLDFSNHSDIACVRNAVNSARNAARRETREENATTYDTVKFHELEALAHEMDAKVLETKYTVLSKDASPVEVARQAECEAGIALARAYRDEASVTYEATRQVWLAE